VGRGGGHGGEGARAKGESIMTPKRMPKIPSFVRSWAEKQDLDCKDHELLLAALAASDEWQEVFSEIVEEEKYCNVNEVVLKQLESNRFILICTHSLPYGITDYGTEPEDEDIEEVFPVEVVVTQYRTKEQMQRSHREAENQR
jgi:hypothetical protein